MNTTISPDLQSPAVIDRRKAVQWMLSAIAAAGGVSRVASAGTWKAAGEVVQHTGISKGYGTDPDLSKLYKPGDLWNLTLSKSERESLSVLCDLLFPADDVSPSATALNVPDFVDEWISAPYPETGSDREPVLSCIAWFESESLQRFQEPLAKLAQEKLHLIADDVAYGAKSSVFKKPAQDFARLKYVVAGGFYTTPEGMKDIGYVGNVPTVNFDGPTPEALTHVGLL
jgi:hypothetical protein